MDKFTYFAVAFILIVQIYKLIRPVFSEKDSAKGIINGIDKGLGFVYSVVPSLYTIIEDMTQKGQINKNSKWINFLKLLSDQAEKEGVELSDRDRERARLIVDSLAAENHIKTNPM